VAATFLLYLNQEIPARKSTKKGLRESEIYPGGPSLSEDAEWGDFVTCLLPNPLFQSLASSTHPLVT
jgi:hypothetical protein